MGEMSKIQMLECEKKLLLAQQSNYQNLCKVLTDRHIEILKYISYLKSNIEKVVNASKENVMYVAYLSNKSIYENNIVKLDKQIQIMTESIQSSQAQISDTEEQLYKEQLKRLSITLPSSNNFVNQFHCDYFDCTEAFSSKQLLDIHIETHRQDEQNGNISFASLESSNSFISFDKKNLEDSKANEVIFTPHMELETMEFSNNQYTNHGTEKNNGFKKMVPCNHCGKFFNKHYIESHKRSHTGAKPFKCSVDGCNRTFTQSSSRNFHEKRFHRIGKSQCSYLNCDMSFDRLEEMQKHLQQHQALINTVAHSIEIKLTDQNLQSVPGKAMSNRSKSNRSTDGNLKHVCIHCGKSFAYKIALKQHALMHGSKNFRCPFEGCSYASYWKHNLGLHLRKHHNPEVQ